MMGLLPSIAHYFHVSIPVAGHLITAYALGVVVGAPLLVIASNKIPPKLLLITLMGLFVLFNGLSALAPNYDTLLVSRFLSGLPHGAFFGVGSVVATRIAEPGKESRSIALMFAGLTIANLFGVPLGTFIGYHESWRATFLLIALIGACTVLSLIYWMPKLPIKSDQNIKHELRFFTKLDSWLLIVLIAIGTGGLFSWFSYVAPLLTDVSHFARNDVPALMALAGLGMLIGNAIGGRLADAFKPINVTIALLLTMTITLLLVHFLAPYKILSLIMTFVIGAVSFALVAPIQLLMISSSKDSEMLASAISQACFNIGNALGSFLGGLPLVYGFAFNSPELVGAGMTSFSILIGLSLLIRRRANSELKTSRRLG
jgi:DHA1 family arabinose polymer transporter-like MFS transporter